MGLFEIVLLGLVLALGVLLDAVLGRTTGEFMQHLGLGPSENGKVLLSRIEALCGPGALMLLGVGVALMPAQLFPGTLLALCGLCLGVVLLRHRKRMRQ